MNSYQQITQRPRGNAAPLPGGFWASQGGAYTQDPTSNQFVSTQLNDLIASDSEYIQQARNAAAAQANARGLGNSSYAAGNAQGAAIRAALPIASQDASMMSAAALHNQDALNNVLMSDRQNATSMANARSAAAASRYGSDRSYAASRYGQDAETGRQQAQNQFDSEFKPYLLGLQNQYAAQDWSRDLYGNILQGAYGTIYSNPDYFNDPNAAMGFINGFGTFAGNQIDAYMYGGGSP